MSTDFNFLELILGASIVVQIVIAVLILFSIISWGIMIQRSSILRNELKESRKFEDRFWSGEDLYKLYDGISNKRETLIGSELIFFHGFKEFLRLKGLTSSTPDSILLGSTRAMNLSMNRELESVEKNISFLATVSSISPYIGLFGTVWGIMHAFVALSNVKQATLQMVAPGIAEALIATAIGLFAAIPALMAYNRLNSKVTQLDQSFSNFIDEFTAILHRQVFSKNATDKA